MIYIFFQNESSLNSSANISGSSGSDVSACSTASKEISVVSPDVSHRVISSDITSLEEKLKNKKVCTVLQLKISGFCVIIPGKM